MYASIGHHCVPMHSLNLLPQLCCFANHLPHGNNSQTLYLPNGPSGSFVLLPCLFYLSLCPFVFSFFNFTILLFLLLLSFSLSLSFSTRSNITTPPFCSLMCRIIKIVCSTICHSTNLSRNHYVACQLNFCTNCKCVCVCVCVLVYICTHIVLHFTSLYDCVVLEVSHPLYTCIIFSRLFKVYACTHVAVCVCVCVLNINLFSHPWCSTMYPHCICNCDLYYFVLVFVCMPTSY